MLSVRRLPPILYRALRWVELTTGPRGMEGVGLQGGLAAW